MPKGKGTYGSKRGRPKKSGRPKKKSSAEKQMESIRRLTGANTKRATQSYKRKK
tara:strand:- start:458 stop:619 length:162 start_codon:yes stop_codon:yes gene_type:complete